MKTIEHELCVGGIKEGKRVPVNGHYTFMSPAPISYTIADIGSYVTTERYHRAKIGNGRGVTHALWCKEGEDVVDGLVRMAGEDRWILSEKTIETIMRVVQWARHFDNYGPHDPEDLKNAMEELLQKYHDAHYERRYSP